MKTANIQIEVISISCPKCGESVNAPGGAQNLTEVEYEFVPHIIECNNCGEKLRKPSVTWYRGRRWR